jgi:3alpha(or 20beta)-hydroxysteroid dehydrogenase
MKELKGRIALVTGGAQGIGAATAKALADAGAKVVISDIGDGEATAKSIDGAYVKHDVTKEDDWPTPSPSRRKRSAGSTCW